MKTRTIKWIISIATIIFTMLVIAQASWFHRAQELQMQQISVHEQQLEIEEQQFNDRVIISLTNVRDNIFKINQQNVESYFLEPVNRISPNYFVVSIIDTIHPTLLERLIVDEFKKNNVIEDFEFGIYDCFNDSIIYDRYVALATEQTKELVAPQQKWNHDGHYFGVYFPNRDIGHSKAETPQTPYILYVSTLILLILLAFIIYTIWLILKQKRLSDIKNDFINNMTHELKTPISTIHLSTEILSREGIEKSPERIKQYAQIINNENKRLEMQVEKVLQLATLDRAQIQLNDNTINIHEVIDNIINQNNLNLSQKEGKIHTHLNAKNSLIKGDEVHINNIINNLVDNAIKYSDHPEISISTKNIDSGVSISIKDNGLGLTSEQVKQVFEKFYRVPTGNVHNVKGFGLGLYYVKIMVDAHKGKIELKSEHGKGSEFIIWLPLKQ